MTKLTTNGSSNESGLRLWSAELCRQRAGAALLAALVVLMLAMLMSAALVRQFVLLRRHMEAEQRRQQANWLADSALQRAVARLRASADYTGESWDVQIDIDGNVEKGMAEIRVQPSPGESNQRMIQVDAVWPNHPLDRVLEQREIQIQLTNSGAST